MEDADFTDEFCRFIQAHVPSVEAAELLILLLKHPDAAWSAEEAVARLPPGVSLAAAEAGRLLEAFHARGLHRPLAEQHRPHLEMLARAYKERPVTLIRIIYALRDTKIQSFAEAFRLRKRR